MENDSIYSAEVRAAFPASGVKVHERANDPRYWYVVYDSDGNPVEATGRPERIGAIITRHYALVDRTPGADEPFLTVRREAQS
jgi:hypothetical protein